MKFISNIGSYKHTIIFIHGYNKNAINWNISETGKELNIEHAIAKVANTVLISMDSNDYKNSITSNSEQIYLYLHETSLITTKLTCVGHSFGCFNCLRLAELYPNAFERLLLIDPTVKSEPYYAYLKETNSVDKLNYWDDIPDMQHLKNKVIVRVHLNVLEGIAHLQELSVLTNKNIKSRLMVHYNVGHMIHYKIPEVIFDSIKEIYKL